MRFKTLGNSGLKVSVAGLGCNNFGMKIDQAATDIVVGKALDLGITLFDTADAYGNKGGSETMLGKALGPRRKEIVLATKFGLPMGDGEYMKGGSRRYIVNAVEASLKRLGTDYIDLYQLHFPDPDTPIEETLAALDDLVHSGKVRYIGSSNLTGWQFTEAAFIAKERRLTPFVSAQNHYNLLDRKIEFDLVPAVKKYGGSVLPYFPLASGMLTGKYKRGRDLPNDGRLTQWGERGKGILTDANFDLVEKVTAFAETRGKTTLDAAIGWLASQPHVASVIAGATKPEQVEANVKASEWEMNAEELDEMNRITFRL
ncbi:aldo/keto reductase [Parvibaculum sp.]|uniref:aldo/keto reductase n=1 Tax=Parvibaculum sp. TaxID=2024848 RepID=UPI00272FDEB2|nr:aldo/keto reductase [Parvibaculum sp.]MDP1626630.1 aldo/keto reductase [Parvibaculum sp.]MDP2150551.1 aldo/keto reductase [Parvibaculum sp.]MDP3327837.1 aldo/keto reductase [Parvibaculum sp.]